MGENAGRRSSEARPGEGSEGSRDGSHHQQLRPCLGQRNRDRLPGAWHRQAARPRAWGIWLGGDVRPQRRGPRCLSPGHRRGPAVPRADAGGRPADALRNHGRRHRRAGPLPRPRPGRRHGLLARWRGRPPGRDPAPGDGTPAHARVYAVQACRLAPGAGRRVRPDGPGVRGADEADTAVRDVPRDRTAWTTGRS